MKKKVPECEVKGSSVTISHGWLPQVASYNQRITSLASRIGQFSSPFSFRQQQIDLLQKKGGNSVLYI